MVSPQNAVLEFLKDCIFFSQPRQIQICDIVSAVKLVHIYQLKHIFQVFLVYCGYNKQRKNYKHVLFNASYWYFLIT